MSPRHPRGAAPATRNHRHGQKRRQFHKTGLLTLSKRRQSSPNPAFATQNYFQKHLSFWPTHPNVLATQMKKWPISCTCHAERFRLSTMAEKFTPATQPLSITEWLSGWVAASATLPERLSGWVAAANWLKQPLTQSEWLSGCWSSHSQQSGWVAEWPGWMTNFLPVVAG